MPLLIRLLALTSLVDTVNMMYTLHLQLEAVTLKENSYTVRECPGGER